MAHNEMHGHGAGEELHHEPLPVKMYIGVFASLLFLTFVTVFIANFHFGEFNLIVAMAVAVAKASLVVLYFMNLKHDHDRFNGVIFCTGLFFLLVFIAPTMWDARTRGDVDPQRGARSSPSNVVGAGATEPLEPAPMGAATPAAPLHFPKPEPKHHEGGEHAAPAGEAHH